MSDFTSSFGRQPQGAQGGWTASVSPAAAPAPATSTSAAVKDVTTASFRQDVIAESMNVPVLVDFWAPWCGPCKQLAPTLERVVAQAGGRVKLVKLNIDDHPQIPGQLGIQSIPAVIAFVAGQPVDGFMGNVPESQIKDFIARIAGPAGPSPVEEILQEAEGLVAAGDLGGAAELYGAVLAQDAQNLAALAGMARLHVETGDLDGARQFLAMVPPDKTDDPVVAGVRAALELAEQAASIGDTRELEAKVMANPLDHQSRFDLAIALSAKGDKEAATDHLLEIVRKDRTWNEDGARKQLLQFFEAWGPMDDATAKGRRRLSAVLFS